MKQLTGILAVLVVCSAYTQAQIIYSSGLEDGTGWAIVAEEDTSAVGMGLYRPGPAPGTERQRHRGAAVGFQHHRSCGSGGHFCFPGYDVLRAVQGAV